MGYVALHHCSLAAWRHAQWEHMEEAMKAGRDMDGTVSWIISDLASLDWENAHEIRLHGEMYDVLGVKLLADGRWELRCLSDAQETHMKARFEATLRGTEQGPDGASGPLVQRLLAANYVGLPMMLLQTHIAPPLIIQARNWALSPQASIAPDGQPPQPGCASIQV